MYTDDYIEYWGDVHQRHDLYRVYGVRFDTFLVYPQRIMAQRKSLRPIPVSWPPGETLNTPPARRKKTSRLRAWVAAAIVIIAAMITTTANADDWTARDTQWQAAYLTLHAIDWGQTRDIANKCSSTPYYERNPALGSCPSRSVVDFWFVTTAISHTAIMRMLSPKKRRAWQKTTITTQFAMTANNYHIGLQVAF